ncbi:glycosyltransferase involved in cell wall biosynthesis [Robbsia andropogonis]|uniref:glycosyltransferase n=1 Tax=Robbsia andropogonis TaxID=28092 RepID=UPI0004B795E0|nr:glycosyltransferase [Robbsia andropogonis]
MITGPLLLVCPHLPPRFRGGVEVYSQWLIEALGALSKDLIVLSIIDFTNPIPKRQKLTSTLQKGVTYYWLQIDALYMAQPRTHFFNEAVFDAVTSILKNHHPVAVHVQGGFRITPAPLFAAYKSSIPIILTLHDYYFICPTVNLIESSGNRCTGIVDASQCATCITHRSTLTQDWFEDWMEDHDASGVSLHELATMREATRKSLGLANVLLSPSQDLAARYLRTTNKHEKTLKIHVHRLGVPQRLTAEVAIGAYPLNSNPPDQRLVFAYIGHIHPHKGVHLLVDAAARMSPDTRNWTLKIYGEWADSPYHHSLHRSAAQHPNIALCGAYDPDNIAQILADVDIVLLPSLWSENAPLVMLLALRYGVPVMASRIGGIPEWVRDTINGWLVAPGDPIAWAKAMAHCIEHRDRIKDRAGNCRYPLTSEDEAKALVRVYQSSAGQRE